MGARMTLRIVMEGSLAQSGPGTLYPWSSLLASPALALGILLTCISCHLHPTPFFGPYCAGCGIIIPCRDQTQACGSENSGSPDHSSAREVPQTPCSSYLSVRLAPPGVRQTPPPGSAAPFNQPSPPDLSPSQPLLGRPQESSTDAHWPRTTQLALCPAVTSSLNILPFPRV